MIDYVFDALEMTVFTFLFVVVVLTFFLRGSQVSGGSMDTTLANGDQVFMYCFLYTPERGDIVVFQDKTTGTDEPLVKRVIALEGDTVRIERIDALSCNVYVNGELLEEDYVTVDGAYYKDPSGEWTVGKGEVFVMGDHRNTSRDSREFGPVPAESIIGKVIFRYLPFDSFGLID